MKTSKALQEVWEMKAAAYEETKHLQGAAYFAYIHAQVRQLLPAGMKLRTVTEVRRPNLAATMIAETPAKYRAGRRQTKTKKS